MKQRHARHKLQTWESYTFHKYIIQLRAQAVVRINAFQFAVSQLNGKRLDPRNESEMEQFRELQRVFIAQNTGPILPYSNYKGKSK